MSASSVPKTMPPVAANAVSSSVKLMPSRKRYGNERMMTSKTKLANISMRSHRLARGTDEPRHGSAALQQAHAEGNGDIDQNVNERSGGEGFEHLKRELLHGTGARGELHQTDRKRHRTVLDDVEKFRSERRQDDAKRHGQQHVGIGLRQGEAEGESRKPLPASEAHDPGAHLLGYPRRGIETKRDDRRIIGGVGKLLEPIAKRHRKQLRQHEIPEEHLHQQRDIAEDLYVGITQPHQPWIRRGAHNSDERAEDQRHAPG